MVDWTSQIFTLIFSAIIGSIFIYIGAKVAKIEDATFLKAFEAALIGAILALILGLITTWGSIIAFILVIAVIKFVYNTSWGKAFIAWLVYFIVLIIIVVIIVVIIGAALFMAFG